MKWIELNLPMMNLAAKERKELKNEFPFFYLSTLKLLWVFIPTPN